MLIDAPRLYEDLVSDGVRVVTHYDAQTDRWTTAVVGGSIDTWSTTYREDADPVIQHAKAVTLARESTDMTATGEPVKC